MTSSPAIRRLLGAWPLAMLLAGTSIAGCGEKGDPQAEKRAAKYVELGEDYLAAGESQKALAAYSKAIQTDPDCQTAYVRRGMAYNDAGKHDRAISDFSKAIELDPRDSFPYELRRDLYRNVYRDEARAKADDEAATLIRQGRWEDLRKLRQKR
jgi:tetratricopeptide (TPR) repeat protein